MVNSTGPIGLPPIQTSPLGYTGSPANFVPITNGPRDPTGLDINYATGTEWTNTVSLAVWKLLGFISGVAQWINLSSGTVPPGVQLSLSDTSGTKTFPDMTGNIQLNGSGGIVVSSNTPGSNEMTISSNGSVLVEGFIPDDFTSPGTSPVLPTGSNITVSGKVVGPHLIPVQTNSTVASELDIEVQISSDNATSDADHLGLASFSSHQFTVDGNGWVNALPAQATTATPTNMDLAGVAQFNDAQFTADSNGFVSLIGGPTPPTLGIDVDAHTAPGTDPVIPNGSGEIALTGAQVATGVVGANVMRSNSLAANSVTLQIQRSTAVASTDSTKNGVAHFDSGSFTSDSSAFISLNPSFILPTRCAFLASVGTSVNNVTGNGTTYQFIYNIEAFDQGSNYNNSTGVFTAPVTGVYQFTATCRLIGSVVASCDYSFSISTTGKIFTSRTTGGNGSYAGGGTQGDISQTISVIVKLTAGNTVFTTINVLGQGSNVLDVEGDGTSSVNFFSGALLF